MTYEYRIIEGLARQAQEQMNQAAQEGWEPVHMGSVGQPAASGSAIYVHVLLLLRRPISAGDAPTQPR
jgi:hypothetical protein